MYNVKHRYETMLWILRGESMAKQIEGVYERILACAKREFLDKGYTDASLRTIAANADTSTNSIYVRFKDKEGLFSVIVEPAVNGLMDMFMEAQETFHSFDQEKQRQEMGSYTQHEMERLIDYIYDNLDAFHLLLDASYGTRFQYFVDELVRVEVKYTHKFMEVMGYQIDFERDMTENLLHIVTTSYFEGMFEVIRHGMGREESKRYMTLLGEYHHTGFSAIFFQEQN